MYRTFLASFPAVLTVALPAYATSIHVPADQPTIQAAIDAAANGDEIIVADGTYTGLGNRDIDFNGKLVTVRSAGGPTACIIDCSNAGRAFTLHNGENTSAVVQGFTIRNGNSTSGGAINCASSSPTVIDCVFENNSSSFNGGTISNTAASPTIKRCEFKSNTAQNAGGGVFNDNGSNPAIQACRFLVNHAIDRGGGAIYNNRSSSPIIVNCVFAGNETPLKGAAVYTENGNPAFLNCSFAANIAGQDGGAILLTNSGSVSVRNCILWGDGPNEIAVSPGVASVEYCDIQGTFAGVGNIAMNPLFADASSGDLHIDERSPCVDAGNNLAVPGSVTLDFDSNDRFVDVPTVPDSGAGLAPIIDMGAFEVQAAPCLADISGDGVVNATDLLLVINLWGPCPGPPNICVYADIQPIGGNGVVNAGDLLAVINAWGPCQ